MWRKLHLTCKTYPDLRGIARFDACGHLYGRRCQRCFLNLKENKWVLHPMTVGSRLGLRLRGEEQIFDIFRFEMYICYNKHIRHLPKDGK